MICDDLSVTYISEDHPQTPGHFILYGVPGNYSDKKRSATSYFQLSTIIMNRKCSLV